MFFEYVYSDNMLGGCIFHFIVVIFHVFWYLYSNNVFGFCIPVIALDLYIPIETFMGYPGLYIFQRSDVSFVGEMSGNPGRAPN